MNDVQKVIAVAVVILIGIQIIQLNSYLRKRAKKIAYGFFAVVLGITFAFLHYMIYLDHADHNGILDNLRSYAGSPIYIGSSLELKGEYKPSYLNPFGRLEYRYSEAGSDDIVIIEARTIFSSKIRPVLGDPIPYWKDSGYIFMRDQVGVDYPGTHFYLLQYFILASIIFLITRIARGRFT